MDSTLSAIPTPIGLTPPLDAAGVRAAVWESAGAFRSLIEKAWDGITVLSAEGRIMYASPSMGLILGHSPDEAPGHSAFEIIHPDDMEAAGALFAGVLQAPGASIAGVLRHRHADGSWRWLRGTATNLLDEPAVRGIVCNYHDITESRLAQQALRESEERLRLGLDAGNTGTWDWDIVNDHVTWSDRIYEFHGVHRDVFGGTVADFAKLVHPGDLERVQAAIKESLENRAPYQIEFRVCRPDGALRWLATTGRVFHDETGRPIRMLGATRDITERMLVQLERDRLLESERAARAEAERSSGLKDEFLATLGHELRTPLNAILGWSQLLRTGKSVPPDMVEGLIVIERNARAQAKLIEDLLDVSRIISGKVRLEVQRLLLSTVIEAALDAVRPAADAKGIRLEVALDAHSPPVAGDQNRLTQVLFNLLSNSIKYTPRGGSVRVMLDHADGHVQVSVIDNGEGIARAFLPHVFDRFRQADGTTTRKHGGLGLGLAITKHLVELHGGSIRAASDGPGRGAMFVVSLPRAPAAPDVVEADCREGSVANGPESSMAGVNLVGVRVLIVDDEPDALAMVRRLLEDRNAVVTTASSAAEALELVRREKPQVLVSDIGMPGEDGYVLIRKIRALGAGDGGDVPAIALTAYARSEDRTRAMLAGYQTHIAKPLEASELIATVASLAGRVAR